MQIKQRLQDLIITMIHLQTNPSHLGSNFQETIFLYLLVC